MYDELLQHEERREEALPVEREGQLELLTMLKAGLETYSEAFQLKEHPLTYTEEELVSSAYDLLASRFGIVIPSLPVWFVASADASDASKLTRLGLSSSRPKSGSSEEVMETASQWWELHHPHIVRFMGACHVGQSPYFVHERTRSLALYLGANGKTRGEVWKRLLEAARGVEYLHRRGFVHKRLMPADFLCAEFEAKTLLSGMGLVARRSERRASAPALADIRDACITSGGIAECPVVEDMRPSVASDICSLGQCVFAFLGFAATTSAGLGSAGSAVPCQKLPSHRPEYLDASEWDLIRKMCATDFNHCVNMTYVLEKMQEITYRVVDEEEKGDARSMMENLDEQVLPGLGFDLTVGDFFVEFDEFSSEPGEPTRKAFTRLLQLHEMMKAAVPSPEPMVVNKYLSLLSRIMDAMDKRSSYSASIQATGSRYIDHTALTFSAEIERVFRLLNVHEGLRVDLTPAFETSYFDKVQRMAQPRIKTSVAEWDDSADSSETQTSDEDRRELEALQQHKDRQAGERRGQGNNQASTLPRWFVPQFEIETGAFIAAGGFGSVYRGQWFGTEVVVKEIILKRGDTQQKRAEFLREANTWFRLNHRNVVKMYGGCHVGRLIFVCEYASQGTLDSFSKAEGRDPLLIWSTLLSAATGLRYLRDVGVVHGDLKGNNILIGKDGVAKLTDFGLSFFRKNADLEAEQGALGAYRWKSPECLDGGVATFASDMFSFGMCIIEAVSGALPWGNRIDDIAVKYHVTKGELPNRPAVFEDEEWNLVQQMCCLDPKQRLNIVSVVVRLTAIVKRRDANRRQLLQAAYNLDMLSDGENERMDAHTGGLDTLLQLVQSGVASRQNAAIYSMQTFSALTQDNVLAEQEVAQVVKLFHSYDTKQDWAAIALGYVNCPCSAIRADVTSYLLRLIERESDGLLKAEAVRAIGYLASDETSRTLIVRHGAIPSLLEMVRAGSEAEQADAARTLGCLAIGCEQNQDAIGDAGAIDALASLIVRGTYQQRIEGALALRRLAEGNAKIGELVRSKSFRGFLDIRADATHRDAARILNEIARMRSGDEWKVKGSFPALVDLMLYGDDQQKNEAQTVLYARGHDRKNDRVTIPRDPVDILIAFVRVGTAEEKLESTRELHRLAADNDDNRLAIALEGGVAPLVALVRDGTDSQKLEASETLGRLADGNDATRMTIIQEGGIAPLVTLVGGGTYRQRENALKALKSLVSLNDESRHAICAPLVALVRDGTNSQKEKAANALGLLADGNDATRITIVQTGGIAPLVVLMRDGTDWQKKIAVEALGHLADCNDATRIAIVQKEGIAPLVALVQDGTDSQKYFAAEALRRLADGNDATQIVIAQEGGIALLVALVVDGTPCQRENALKALKSLVGLNDESRRAICAPLVALVRDGTNSQKEKAANALGLLADGNDATRITIVQTGGIAPLVTLVGGGTYRQRENALKALKSLVSLNDESRHAICAPLVALVRDGTNSQKENAAEALALLAAGDDATQIAIAREGGIAPLVTLVGGGTFYQRMYALKALESLVSLNNESLHAICAPLVALVCDGTDSQKGNAVEALCRLTDGDDATQIAIAREGGIAPLVALTQDGTDWQKEYAAKVLGRLVGGNDAIRIAVARQGGIAPLVALVGDGTFDQRMYAQYALKSLVRLNNDSLHAICAPLVALVRDGTNSQKENAAEALALLAAGDDATQIAIAREGGIAPLVTLVGGGTFYQRMYALKALESLVSLNNESLHAICAPLVALVCDGTDSQKGNAVEALCRLTDGDDANRIVIAREGGIAPLVALTRDGTDWQKENAAKVLGRLVGGNDAIRIAIAREGGRHRWLCWLEMKWICTKRRWRKR
ncbi:hypothetical protein BBJ28_00022301 [Nothophytophthora sp. Chile5]|nr:hypothetical protein BBJ28_00022301 [Nothophytophthora sp. Chile5]